jgi:hypothetical protein
MTPRSTIQTGRKLRIQSVSSQFKGSQVQGSEVQRFRALRLWILDFGFWIEGQDNLGIANLGIQEFKIRINWLFSNPAAAGLQPQRLKLYRAFAFSAFGRKFKPPAMRVVVAPEF